MKFHVGWSRDAIDDLGTTWLNAVQQHRAAVTAAADRIERELENDPHHKGESRSEDRRVFFEPPIGVLFNVNLRLRTVTITQVWLFRTH